MNERIRLDFVEYNPRKAALMLECARTFGVSKPDGRSGPRHGTVWTFWHERRFVVLAYWTKARMIVVAEEDRNGG